MYSEVFEPKEATLTIDIPNEFIGKRITVEIKLMRKLRPKNWQG